MQITAQIIGFLALLASGVMAGFFYSYSFSVMWGLDRADPRHAIGAMNGINIAVVNPIFLAFFMGLPVLAIAAAVLFWQAGQTAPFLLFAAVALTYLVGTFGVTMAVNVPMNDALAKVAVPQDVSAARDVWTRYSSNWTPWNHLRTAAVTLAFALAGLGLLLSA